MATPLVADTSGPIIFLRAGNYDRQWYMHKLLVDRLRGGHYNEAFPLERDCNLIYLSHLASSTEHTKNTISVVDELCTMYGILPDFSTYLFRIGPCTLQNMAYNSFQFRNSIFKGFRGVPRSGLSEFKKLQETSKESIKVNDVSQDSFFSACYLLKLPPSPPSWKAPVPQHFGISHIAIYQEFKGLDVSSPGAGGIAENSFTMVMEDLSYAYDDRTDFMRSISSVNTEPFDADQIVSYFGVLSLESWGHILDRFEPRIYGRPTTIATGQHQSGQVRLSSPPTWLEKVGPDFLSDALVTTCNAIASNLSNIKSLRDAYQASMIHGSEMRLSSIRSQFMFQSLIDECERQLKRAENLSAQIRGQEALVSHVSDLVKLTYISQNHSRGNTVVAILLLPGIFVSTLLSTSIFENTNPLALWFAIAMPMTVAATLAVLFAWRLPIFWEQVKEYYRERKSS